MSKKRIWIALPIIFIVAIIIIFQVSGIYHKNRIDHAYSQILLPKDYMLQKKIWIPPDNIVNGLAHFDSPEGINFSSWTYEYSVSAGRAAAYQGILSALHKDKLKVANDMGFDPDSFLAENPGRVPDHLQFHSASSKGLSVYIDFYPAEPKNKFANQVQILSSSATYPIQMVDVSASWY